MTVQWAERALPIMSILGIWVTFLVGRGFREVQAQSYFSDGADLPALTSVWLELTASWATLVFPAICTVLITWLIWRRSVHLNWVTGCLLLFGMFYGVLGHAAAVLPAFKMCGSV